MENSPEFLAVIVLVTVIAGGACVLLSRRSRHMLEEWVDENGYRLVRAEHRMFLKGPFMWSGRGQVVYRVEVENEWGARWKGWVRCGSWTLGLLSDKVEARWDDLVAL